MFKSFSAIALKRVRIPSSIALSSLFVVLGLASVSQAERPPLTCVIRTANNHLLTAVGGGGRITDVIHSDATSFGTWETFRLIDVRGTSTTFRYAIETVSRNYLTAVGGGGRTGDVVHSNATRISNWEKFTLIPFGNDIYAIQTYDGHFLTAVGAGGRITDVIHSDATSINAWRNSKIVCGY